MAHALGYLSRWTLWLRSGTRERFAKSSHFPLRRAVLFAVLAQVMGESVPALRAQAPAGPSLRFTVFSARPIADLAFVPRPNAPPQKVVFYPTARSPRYDYRGATPLRFVDASSGAVVAEATIPAEIHDGLLLFAPVPAAGGTVGMRYHVSVLDDGSARHGPGGLAVINLSGLALTGTIGTTSVTLKPGLNPTIPVGRSAKVILKTEAKNRSYQSYADTVELARNQRALLILFPPFYQGSLEVQSRLLIDEPPGSAPPPKK